MFLFVCGQKWLLDFFLKAYLCHLMYTKDLLVNHSHICVTLLCSIKVIETQQLRIQDHYNLHKKAQHCGKQVLCNLMRKVNVRQQILSHMVSLLWINNSELLRCVCLVHTDNSRNTTSKKTKEGGKSVRLREQLCSQRIMGKATLSIPTTGS